MVAMAVGAIPARRFAAAAIVLALHATLLFLLLHANFSYAPQQAASPERVYWLTTKIRPQAPVHVEAPIVPMQRPKPFSPPAFRMPDFRGVTPPPATNGATDLQGLHAFLFDCAPENLTNLTADQRVQCGTAMKKPNDSVDYADHTNRSKSAPLWARRLAKKQNPLLLPCMSPQAASPLYTAYCLGKGIFTGFDLDSMPGYGDKPEQVHVPNGGDPPPSPAYNMRH